MDNLDDLAEVHRFAAEPGAVIYVYDGWPIPIEAIRTCNGDDVKLSQLIRSIQNGDR